MTVKSAALTVLLMVAILMVAACTSPSNGTPTTIPTSATPVPTTVPATTPPTTTVVSITPGPTDLMPENLQAEFQVDPKDPIYANVRVAYRGGTATIHITHVDVILTKADGTVIRKTLPESGARKVQVGDEVIMQGTRQKTDRLQVTVTLDNGNVYRVIDQLLP